MKAPTILVVEDSPTELKVVVATLRSQGYRVLSATDGEQALALAVEESPDLVVLDLMLPKKSGFQVCRQIKSSPGTQATKVIILSSKTESSDRFWGLRQGADSYLAKPCGEQELLSEIARILGQPESSTLPSSSTPAQ